MLPLGHPGQLGPGTARRRHSHGVVVAKIGDYCRLHERGGRGAGRRDAAALLARTRPLATTVEPPALLVEPHLATNNARLFFAFGSGQDFAGQHPPDRLQGVRRV